MCYKEDAQSNRMMLKDAQSNRMMLKDAQSNRMWQNTRLVFCINKATFQLEMV